MKRFRAFRRCAYRRAGAMFFFSMWLTSAGAEEVLIQASFKPDSANPQRNKFTNDTPLSGYCASFPQQCIDNEMFSLRVPIQFNSSRPIMANHEDPRQGATIKTPAQWQELTVFHESAGQAEIVKVRIAGIGSRYATQDVISLVGGGTDYRVAHNQLWGNSSWVNAPAPCQYSGVGAYSTTTYAFFWKTPIEDACVKRASFNVPWLRYDYLDFAYELVTPNPLGMSSGKYIGSMSYTLGPGADFDMGDIMLPSINSLTLNFELDVQHTLKVDVPPGGNHVELVPPGGWQSWVTQGRKPTRLLRDQTFNVSASSRFKMTLQCQYPSGINCALWEPISGHSVPLEVSVTLPHGIVDASQQPVSRRRLRRDGVGTELFQPGIYVDRKPGTLHFEVAREAVQEMLSPNVSRSYSGSVTVIWDSEVG